MDSNTLEPRGLSSADDGGSLIAGSYRRNAFYFISLEFVWGLGAPCCMIYTMIPAYLRDLDVSKTWIQIITIAITALSVLMVFSSHLFHAAGRKKRIFFVWQLFCGLWILYGALAAAAYDPAARRLWIGLFSIMCLGVGVILALGTPPFEELFLQNMPLKKRGLVSALRALGLGTSGLTGSLAAIWLFQQWATPLNYHLRFILGGAVMAASLFLLVPFRDHASQLGHAERSASFQVDVRRLLANFNFRILLVFYMLLAAALSLAPLMLTYGKDILGMEGRGDYFTAAWFAGSMIFGLSIPLLADRFGFKLLGTINAALLTIAFLCPVLAGPHSWILFFGYLLFGACSILTFFLLPNLGSEMAPEVRPATIFAVGTILALPLALLAAPLAGLLVDLLGHGGYIGAFMLGAAFSLCALLGFLFIIREPRIGQELFLRMRPM